MSLILVVESESRHAERARDGLGSDGWTVEVVGSCEEAVAAAANRAPQLLLVNATLIGAGELLHNFARAQGGPGSIALTPELTDAEAETAAREADEAISTPFQEQDLRQAARRVTSAARVSRKVDESPDSKKLTSRELFGDLLAEVESEMALPAAPAPAAISVTEKPRSAAAPPRRSENIDEMLSRTLSGLDVGKRPAKTAPREAPATPPAKPAEPAAATRSTSPTSPLAPPKAPIVPTPVASPAPATGAPPPPLTAAPASTPPSPPPKAPSTSPSAAKAPADPATSRRASREIDLSQLDALARPRSRESTPAAAAAKSGIAGPETFATQKITIQPSFLQPPSSAFGQYTLLDRIAVGGMAEVWKARMKGVEGFQKTVAIKKILPHLTDSSDFVTMFIDEAKLAAQLNHNNIIHIYDLGKINDDYFIAMEFVDGKDLRTILNTARAENQPLPMGLALLVGSRLAAALDHAHRQKDFEDRPLGLVHRDVSPQNVLISYDGDIKLCDFGIVKAVTKASKTQMGALKGKLQYMSPEQAWGRPVDARSDLFSLGSLLFEMLTGRRLFSGESEMSVLDAVREGRIQAPRDLDPRLPLEINALVLKALARDPEDRFQNAGEMQREIDSIHVSLKPPPSQTELGTYLQRLFAGERGLESAPPTGAASPLAAASGSAAPPALAASAAVPAKKADVAVVAPTGVSKVEDADSAKGRNLLWLAIAGAAVAGLIAYLVLGRGRDKAVEPSAPAPPAVTAPNGDPNAAPPAGGEATEGTTAGVEGAGTADAAAAESPAAAVTPDVSQMVSDEVKRREEALKKKYEEELAKRRTEIEQLNAKSAPVAPEPKPTTPATPAKVEAPPESVPEALEPEPVESAPVPAPIPAAVAPTAPAEPKAPVVKEGDLVQPGAGVRPPVLASFTKPEYPPIARRLKVEGTVVISLLVDENGRVLDTRLDSGVAQNVGINEASLAAARSARFNPATKNGVRVKMWYQLKIPFKL